MRVRCRANSFSSIEGDVVARLANVEGLLAVNADHPPVVVGDVYRVYGVSFINGNIWFEIAPNGNLNMVVSVLSVFFEVVGPEMSAYWSCEAKNNEMKIWPKSWLAIPYYFDRLSDGDDDVARDFNELKKAMDTED